MATYLDSVRKVRAQFICGSYTYDDNSIISILIENGSNSASQLGTVLRQTATVKILNDGENKFLNAFTYRFAFYLEGETPSQLETTFFLNSYEQDDEQTFYTLKLVDGFSLEKMSGKISNQITPEVRSTLTHSKLTQLLSYAPFNVRGIDSTIYVDFTNSELDTYFSNITWLELIESYCGYSGKFAIMDDSSTVTFISPPIGSTYSINKDNYFSFNKIGQSMGVKSILYNNKVYNINGAGTVLELSKNLISDAALLQSATPVLSQRVSNANYSLSWRGNPSLSLGRSLSIDGKEVVLLQSSLTYDGSLQCSSSYQIQSSATTVIDEETGEEQTIITKPTGRISQKIDKLSNRVTTLEKNGGGTSDPDGKYIALKLIELTPKIDEISSSSRAERAQTALNYCKQDEDTYQIGGAYLVDSSIPSSKFYNNMIYSLETNHHNLFDLGSSIDSGATGDFLSQDSAYKREINLTGGNLYFSQGGKSSINITSGVDYTNASANLLAKMGVARKGEGDKVLETLLYPDSYFCVDTTTNGSRGNLLAPKLFVGSDYTLISPSSGQSFFITSTNSTVEIGSNNLIIGRTVLEDMGDTSQNPIGTPKVTPYMTIQSGIEINKYLNYTPTKTISRMSALEKNEEGYGAVFNYDNSRYGAITTSFVKSNEYAFCSFVSVAPLIGIDYPRKSFSVNIEGNYTETDYISGPIVTMPMLESAISAIVTYIDNKG